MYSNMESVQSWSLQYCCSVNQLCPTLCDPMNRSTPGLPVHHQLPEFTQTHVHWVGDAIQPSNSEAFFSSCFQSFLVSGYFPNSWIFASGSQSTGASASVLPMNIQGWLTDLIPLLSKGLSRVFSKHHPIYSQQMYEMWALHDTVWAVIIVTALIVTFWRHGDGVCM